MRRVIEFGKIAFTSDRKINDVDIEIELEETEKGPVFTACGNVWNSCRTDIKMGGQCLDELKGYFKRNKLFMKIYRLWKEYHLNDMHAGTPKQEEALKKAGREIHEDYEKSCEYLENKGLFVDEWEGKPFKYGWGWLYFPIPENDLNEIRELFK